MTILMRFADAASLAAADERLREARIETYMPTPPEDTAPSAIPLIVFGAGMAGFIGGMAMQIYAATVGYPINIGGRPYNSWPAFVPIAFEIAILAAVGAGFASFVVANIRAPVDDFVLALEIAGARQRNRAAKLVEDLQPLSIEETAP